MKTPKYKLIIPVLLLAFTAGTAIAEVTVKIRSIEVDDNVYTPYFNVETEQDHDPGPSQRWVRLTVEYTTKGGWIDELAVRHLALVDNHGKHNPVILTEQTTYINVAPGDHVAYVYMHPNCVKRYGVKAKQLDSGAYIFVDGTLADTAFTQKNAKEKWTSNSDYAVHAGHLLSEYETPFWFINYDYKEMTKHRPHNGHK